MPFNLGRDRLSKEMSYSMVKASLLGTPPMPSNLKKNNLFNSKGIATVNAPYAFYLLKK